MSIRILLTCYWIFTVIITAAYTSSIIAFVTLPVFPDTVDTAEEILSTPDFRWGTQGEILISFLKTKFYFLQLKIKNW